jgi:hypothetical protein
MGNKMVTIEAFTKDVRAALGDLIEQRGRRQATGNLVNKIFAVPGNVSKVRSHFNEGHGAETAALELLLPENSGIRFERKPVERTVHEHTRVERRGNHEAAPH